MIITIDGPSASGKSSVATILARDLHYLYLSSGTLYRALAHWLSTRHGYTAATITQVPIELVHEALEQLVYTIAPDGKAHVLCDGDDITPYLKDKRIDELTSIMSGQTAIRHEIVQWQHAIAQTHDIVAEGRDMGTVAFPHAQHKFFLIADHAVRAMRWHHDQAQRGNILSFAEACAAVQARDSRDEQRAVSPLRPAATAIVIDTTHLDLAAVVARIKALVR